ncbi:MAG: DUF4249 family protein [Bacteroidota bacterium]|nr:DUF4249 family protein [Bacteroidota bacterium]MDP4288227.1 DUF4249 family protein [Bacteroidota bacterium]
MTNCVSGTANASADPKLFYLSFVIRHLSMLLILSGCLSVTESTFTPQIVVQGFLYANEPVDSIVVRRTIAVRESSGDDRVSGARVTLANGDSTYPLIEAAGPVHGRYISNVPIVIQPGKTYRLRVEALGQVATSETTVPDAIRLDSVTFRGQRLSLTDVDSIIYPGTVDIDSLTSPGIHLFWSASPNSAGYGTEALSLDTSDRILGRASLNSDTLAQARYRFFILSTDEQVVWQQYMYFGPNVIRALALDRNFEEYVLGLYLARSQFNNNTLHITGGLGIFGSAARASKMVYLK